MELITHKFCALTKEYLYEIVDTIEHNAAPSRIVNSVAYLRMMKVTSSRLVVVGDDVFTNNVRIGKVVEFDKIHFSNYMNILYE